MTGNGDLLHTVSFVAVVATASNNNNKTDGVEKTVSKG